MQKQSFGKFVSVQIKSRAAVTALLAVFVAFCLGSTVYFAVIGQVRNAVMSACYGALIVPVFYLAEYLLRLSFPAVGLGLLLIMTAGGGILGPCYNLYALVPVWDNIMHALAGAVLACLGYALVAKFIKGDEAKHTAARIIFAICFALALLLLWEMFEYLSYVTVGADMQEDTVIDSFNTYWATGSHNEVVTIDGITKTIIYYGEGQTLVIDGYLDIGLFDTLDDMLMGVIGCAVFALVFSLNKAFGKNADKILIPQSVAPETEQTYESEE